jgi:hypothetical protein
MDIETLKRAHTRYIEIKDQLLKEIGAEPADAIALASRLALASSEESDIGPLLSAKDRWGEITYHYRGTRLEIADIGVKENGDSKHLCVTVLTRNHLGQRTLNLDGDQATRLLALFLLKFKHFNKDLVGGFTYSEIEACESALVSRAGKKYGCTMATPGGKGERDRSVISRIGERFTRSLKMANFICRFDVEGHEASTRRGRSEKRYRADIPPHHLMWGSQKVLDDASDFAEGDILRWYKHYSIKPSILA